MHPFALFLFLTLCFALSQPLRATTDAISNVPSGTIERATKQQILASIPPHTEENVIPFLTSPSEKYTACLVRHETAPGAGGFGNDFCYIQIQETASGKSMWESQCTSVSNANTCALLFTSNGLEIFDGSNSVWSNNAAAADFLLSLELVDQGDMRIHDKGGELAWKASDQPLVDQNCGMPGSPGLASALPPFAQPIGQDQPFGQTQQAPPPPATIPIDLSGAGQGQLHQPNNVAAGAGASQSFGFNSQPLIDNTPYDSGCHKKITWVGVTIGLVIGVFFVLML